jgi:hypothetical protein
MICKAREHRVIRSCLTALEIAVTASGTGLPFSHGVPDRRETQIKETADCRVTVFLYDVERNAWAASVVPLVEDLA